MAHFAEIDENNIVVNILKVPDEHEHRGQEYLAEDCNLGGTWIKTSYNTKGGVHFGEDGLPDGKPQLRKNYAIIGGHYDPEGDAFYPQKPTLYPSHILNKENYTWEPPITIPELPEGCTNETHAYLWDESTISWYLFEIPTDINDKPFEPRLIL
jgi:hypothetical protein